MPLYTFYCTLYGSNLLWTFNNIIVTAYLPNDTVGRTRSITYSNDFSSIYNVTSVLTSVSLSTVYQVPYCVSILTIQPFNESKMEVLPFTVACQTHCGDVNSTLVCQSKHYEVAGKITQ